MVSTLPYLTFYKLLKLQKSRLKIREELLPSTIQNHTLPVQVHFHAYDDGSPVPFAFYRRKVLMLDLDGTGSAAEPLYLCHRTWLNFLRSLTIIIEP